MLAHPIYAGLVMVRVRPLGSWVSAFELPSPRLTAIQYLLGVVELLCAIAVLYVLLPPSAAVGFAAFAAVFIAAIAAGALSGVPAGLGVFESILLVTLTDIPAEELLDAATRGVTQRNNSRLELHHHVPHGAVVLERVH